MQPMAPVRGLPRPAFPAGPGNPAMVQAHTFTTQAVSQAPLPNKPVRGGLTEPSALAESPHNDAMEAGPVQEHLQQLASVQGCEDQQVLMAAMSDEGCSECGCPGRGKCLPKTSEPGRILLVCQVNEGR